LSKNILDLGCGENILKGAIGLDDVLYLMKLKIHFLFEYYPKNKNWVGWVNERKC